MAGMPLPRAADGRLVLTAAATHEAASLYCVCSRAPTEEISSANPPLR